MYEVYIQIYIDIYIHVSLGNHNLGTFYARMLKFGLLLTQSKTYIYMLELLLGHALGWG